MKLANCHPNRKHKARGLCGSCYDKWLKSINPGYKERQLSNTTKWARANPEKMAIIKKRRREKEKNDPTLTARKRDSALKRQYGITLEQYNQMLQDQNNGCKICNRQPGVRPLHVDHCHTTGKVRGLLCHQCNWYLGTIDADPEIINRIITYRQEDTDGW